MMVLSAASGTMVACKSKRWSGKKRAITGAALPLENSSLGGVNLVTCGAAIASVLKRAKASNVRNTFFDVDK